jgi:hypothetical protein
VTFHAFIEYLKYRWKAKTRHGVHSPFAYRLVDEVLLKPSPLALPERIKIYLPSYHIIMPGSLYEWDTILPVTGENTIILLKDIHATTAHSEKWEMLCSNQQVKMSIDMYTYGMLLFLGEFKEKQHFILKYPG